MRRITLESNAQPNIILQEVGGNLHLKSWEKDVVRIDFPNEEDGYTQKDNKITINAEGDCLLRVPLASQVQIQSVGGEANITGVEGKMKLSEVGGSLHLKRVGTTMIESVSGNLNAKDVSGDLKVEVVGGNANLREIHGELLASKVGGNFNLKEAGAKVEVEADGNLSLHVSLPAKSSYKLRAGGNAYCQLTAPVNAKIRLESESGRIFIQTEEGKQNLEIEKHEFSLGKGEASLEITAEGHVDFRSKEEFDDFAFNLDLDFMDEFGSVVDVISEQVGAQMEDQLEALNSQLESLSERLTISGDRAVQKAQRKVEAAQRRLERKLQARGLSPRKLRGEAIGYFEKDKVADDPVSEEERLVVLQMVQDKKISVEDAEMLLATLEGREAPKKKDSKEKAEKS